MADLSTASITERLAALGSERWAVHLETRRRKAAGADIIELTIGEPDVPTPPALIEVAHDAMKAGRTRYSNGKGEPALLNAVAKKYAKRSGRPVTPANVLAFPGTQAALSLCMMGLVEAGDAVLVPDPYYATYEGVVRGTGATFVPVAMDAKNAFHLTAEQLEKAITPNAKVLLLNSPHNPSGATLSADDIAAIGAVCRKHDLWIVSDEVYEPLVYEGTFASPFDDPDLTDRTIAVASISKSHAAPGFRAGWAVGPAWVMDRIQSVSEAVLFGCQPFIADMAAHALTHPDDTTERMASAYRERIDILLSALEASPRLKPIKPKAGMFMLVDVSATGKTGHTFAMELLDHGVAVMPGSSFGDQAEHLVRLSLTVPPEDLREAAARIAGFVEAEAP
ncbi:MAG: aminotransferase class I/II-fold pyridoxal phosphate-dependent enzyme [Pseudomonadota bacterium]